MGQDTSVLLAADHPDRPALLRLRPLIYSSWMTLRSTIAPLANAVLDRAKQRSGNKRFIEESAKARRAGTLKVNIGSGGKPLSGWVNCDVVWRAGSYLDATVPWPTAAGSVDFIYADNVIEHITIENGRLVFQHAFAALAPGGVFRLATPDVESVARQYLENGPMAELGMERNREKGRDFRYPVQLLREVFVGARHYLGFCYDYASISAEMETAGFTVTRVRAGQSEHPELTGLEVRMHPAEEATQLVVEGTKPR